LFNEIKRRVEIAISQPFEKSDKSLLVLLHREVFNSQLCLTCKNEQILAYIELSRLITPKKMSKGKQKYSFNPKFKGVEIMLKGHGRITSETLTDDQAKSMLKVHGFAHLIVEVTEPKVKSEKKA